MSARAGLIDCHSSFYADLETGVPNPKYFPVLAALSTTDIVIRLLTSRYASARPPPSAPPPSRLDHARATLLAAIRNVAAIDVGGLNDSTHVIDDLALDSMSRLEIWVDVNHALGLDAEITRERALEIVTIGQIAADLAARMP